MTSRIDVLEPGETDDEEANRRLEEAREGWYGDSAFFGAMAHQPGLLTQLMDTFDAFPASETIDTELLELMRLRVAEVHRCAYCATVRTQAVAEDVAPREEAVFGEELDADELSRREELAVRLADQMSEDPHRITDEFFDELRTVFSEEEIVELALFASIEVGLDRFSIALTLDTTDESPYPSGLEYPFDRSEVDQ
ncbi:carboxymuconolactone decarboxylase family protein [Natribaculum luteum]|uniref:Carboxymuconolactone decarboxylase family protein n=1 Tax=Natribaculum luteum TaxID=1586232 RepID=A0ABD5NY23_9EURY|nr:carboxymuconolactone decarboxylase family protein [Natribaculum luteum]